MSILFSTLDLPTSPIPLLSYYCWEKQHFSVKVLRWMNVFTLYSLLKGRPLTLAWPSAMPQVVRHRCVASSWFKSAIVLWEGKIYKMRNKNKAVCIWPKSSNYHAFPRYWIIVIHPIICLITLCTLLHASPARAAYGSSAKWIRASHPSSWIVASRMFDSRI